ncbi:MAG: 30S ribosome-binding factor RbfA [bacterium]
MVDEKRKKRIGEMIQHELASVLLCHSEQPLFVQTTITAVNVSADLAVAKVFFSVFDDSKVDEAKKALQQAAGFLRKALAHSINLRSTPRLIFIYDDSIKRGQKISALIDAAIAADEKKFL